MRLPSLDRVMATAGHAARRFPLVLLCAVVAAGAGVLLVDSSVDDDLLERFLYVSSLGLPLFVGITVLAERRRWPGGPLLLARLGGVLLLVTLFFVRPAWSDPVAFLRYVQLSVGFHLFVAFAPYLGVGELNGFWQYNRTLFLRALTTAVFAVVLFAGLAGALAAVDNLLGVDVEDSTYGRLWFLIAFVFSTWFFLGGVPEDLAELETRTDYPAIIKVFSQFILTPIVTIYLVILTVYLGKIIVTRVWPSGWIGYLVSSVAALGILSLLLVHPIEEREENRWIRTYGRWFYMALVPSIVMLLLAIWKRIAQYGITEKRYFLVVLSVWLAGIALFFILRRSRNIKVIPVTLCLVAFVTFVGPWGAFSVSRRSQTARLERLLAANEMLSDGQVRPAPAALSFADRKELSAVVRYLAETHGTTTLDPLFGGRLAQIDTVAPGLGPSDRGDADLRAELILGSLDVEYVGRWAGGSEDAFSFFVQPDGAVISVAGFDLGLRDWGATPDSVEIDGRSYVFELDEERSTISMRRRGEPLIEVPLDPVIRRAREYRRTAVGAPHIPQDVFHVSAENELVRISVYVRSVSGIVESPGEAEATAMEAGAVRYRITSFSADYYWTETAEAP
jgi:hypothetical protein